MGAFEKLNKILYSYICLGISCMLFNVVMVCLLSAVVGLLWGIALPTCQNNRLKHTTLVTFKNFDRIAMQLPFTPTIQNQVTIRETTTYTNITLELTRETTQKDKFGAFEQDYFESNGSVLNIDLKYNSEPGLLLGCPSYTAILHLPRRVYKTLTLFSKTADYHIEGMLFYEINLSGTENNVNITNTDVSLLSVLTSSGNVNLENVVSDTRIKIETKVNGNINMKNTKGMYLGDLRVTSGNINLESIEMAKPETSMEVKVDTAGSINIENWVEGNLTASAVQSVSCSVQSPPKFIELEASTGIKLPLDSDKSLYSYTQNDGNRVVGTYSGSSMPSKIALKSTLSDVTLSSSAKKKVEIKNY